MREVYLITVRNGDSVQRSTAVYMFVSSHPVSPGDIMLAMVREAEFKNDWEFVEIFTPLFSAICSDSKELRMANSTYFPGLTVEVERIYATF